MKIWKATLVVPDEYVFESPPEAFEVPSAAQINCEQWKEGDCICFTAENHGGLVGTVRITKIVGIGDIECEQIPD